MPDRSPLPYPLRLGPFRFHEARALGVTRHRLRQSDLVRAHHGLYALAGAAYSILDRCEHALPLLGEFRWYSHLTAARAWGMPLPFAEEADEPLHVLAFPGAVPLRRPHVVGWATEDEGIGRVLQGLVPLVAPADAWCLLAVPGGAGRYRPTGDEPRGRKRTLSAEWLVAVGDYLLTGPRRDGGRRDPLCTKEDLVAALTRHRGKRGAKALAWAIERVRTPVHSPRETLLRLALIAQGLPEPAVQVPVHTAAGLRHADLGYPDARLLIEYQGDHHRTDLRQWREDHTRRQLFEDAGHRLIAVTAADLGDGGVALGHRIRRALAGQVFRA